MKNVLLILVLALFGCNSAIRNNSIILDYSDFGPQVIANQVIGMEWWQWQPHGDSRPKNYDIKVVVYKEVSLTDIKAAYPVDIGKEKDFRYIEYDKAISFLDEMIADNVMDEVTKKLRRTRERITKSLES